MENQQKHKTFANLEKIKSFSKISKKKIKKLFAEKAENFVKLRISKKYMEFTENQKAPAFWQISESKIKHPQSRRFTSGFWSFLSCFSSECTRRQNRWLGQNL